MCRGAATYFSLKDVNEKMLNCIKRLEKALLAVVAIINFACCVVDTRPSAKFVSDKRSTVFTMHSCRQS